MRTGEKPIPDKIHNICKSCKGEILFWLDKRKWVHIKKGDCQKPEPKDSRRKNETRNNTCRSS